MIGLMSAMASAAIAGAGWQDAGLPGEQAECCADLKAPKLGGPAIGRKSEPDETRGRCGGNHPPAWEPAPWCGP
jgi:hypothetical protein